MALFYDGRDASDSNNDSDTDADTDAVEPPSLQLFWESLTSTVCMPCATYEEIDNALRAWLDLVSSSRDQILLDEMDLARCSQCLLNSPLGAAHIEYVHTQIIYSLLQEDEAGPLHAIANFLLLAGRAHEAVFQQMIEAGCFARLVDLIKGRRDDDRRLHRLLLELMYEMSRIERIRLTDLLHVDDAFVCFLLQIIEDLSDDVTDPYHYPVIRVLLVLNEQYMVAATTAAVDSLSPVAPLTNRVIKVLSLDGPLYRTFGENLILLLNRETETSLQLLILKLLYLLFTTKATYEYFYTNDLRVLLDVIVRNLLDLPNESTSLRHTYLRVLFPLLAHTQLNQPPQYKRDEILRVLAILSGSGNAHFAPADETTMRLVDRVSRVEWLAITPPLQSPAPPSRRTSMDETATTLSTAPATAAKEEAAADANGDTDAGANTQDAAATPATTASATATTAATSRASHASTASSSSMSSGCSSRGAGRDEDGAHAVVNKFLGISLSREGRGSQTSVADMAHVREKPGVHTPSRKAERARAARPGKGRRDPDTDTDSSSDSSSDSDSERTPGVAADPAPPPAGGDTTIQRKTPDPRVPSAPPPRSTAASPVATRPPPPPPDRRPQARRALPTVPKHRHGAVLAKPPPPPPADDAAAAAAAAIASGGGSGGGSSSASPSMPSGPGSAEAKATAAAAAAAAALSGPHGAGHAAHAAHTTHATHATHHNGGIVKKLPPKTPPPRRGGRLKQAASSANLHAALGSRTE